MNFNLGVLFLWTLELGSIHLLSEKLNRKVARNNYYLILSFHQLSEYVILPVSKKLEDTFKKIEYSSRICFINKETF